MTEIIPNLAAISLRYQAIFCDLWGCLHNGRAPFPAAVEALRAARAEGLKVILVTNSPRPSSSVREQLDRIGVPTDAWDDIASSGDAAQFALISGAVGQKVHHIGAPKDLPFFTDFSDDIATIAAGRPRIERVALNDAQGIVCTGLEDDLTETPDNYRAKLLLARTMDLPMLCANPDIVVDMGDRRLWCAGALARDYEEMGGKVLYFGKPHPPIYDLARRRLALLSDERDPQILCIGDGVGTDIKGGVAEGLDTVFITGGIDAAAFGTDSARPDPQLLKVWLQSLELHPTYAMGHLG